MNKSNKRRFSKNKKTRKQKGGNILNFMRNKFDDLKNNTLNLLPENLQKRFGYNTSDTFSTSAPPPAPTPPPAPPPAPPLGGNKTRKNRNRKNRRNK